MKKLLLVLFVSLGVVACAQTPPSDNSSANKNPAQWQQYKSMKGIDELDKNTQ